MKTTFTKTLGSLAIAALLAIGVGTALAGPGGYGFGPGGGMGMGPGVGGCNGNRMGGGPGFDLQMNGFFSTSEQLTEVEKALELTDTQQELWDKFEQAVTDRNALRISMKESHSPGMRWTMTNEEFVDYRATVQQNMLDTRNSVHEAAKALVGSLDNRQKTLMDSKLPFLEVLR